jgi:hypothetical protein
MILNRTLYDQLCLQFGAVSVQNEGAPMACLHQPDLAGGMRLAIVAHGESYYVNCPFCTDTRRRLSVNHRYGVYDPVTRSDNFHLATCFNDDCLKDRGRYRQLADLVFRFMNRDERRRLMAACPAATPAPPARPLAQCPPPGDVVALPDLPPEHPAVRYLAGRGFDVGELAAAWHVLYCVRANAGYPLAQDRLVIPVVRDGLWVGWQARYVGERPWKEERLPKYVTMPGLPRNRLLYNHDLARRQPLAVVCEGPSDVWRVGPAGVALLGKTASVEQLRLLAAGWPGHPVVILLDGDAAADADRLDRQLRPLHRGALLAVRLPRCDDPGGLGREELWGHIRDQASARGVALPGDLGAEPTASPGRTGPVPSTDRSLAAPTAAGGAHD